jgi:transposase-like protein
MKCQCETDARKFDHHTLQVMRMQAVRAHREGVVAPVIAKAMGVSDQTAYRWLRDYFVAPAETPHSSLLRTAKHLDTDRNLRKTGSRVFDS